MIVRRIPRPAPGLIGLKEVDIATSPALTDRRSVQVGDEFPIFLLPAFRRLRIVSPGSQRRAQT